MQALLSGVPVQAGFGEKGYWSVLETMCRYGDAKVRGPHASLKRQLMYAALASLPSTRLVLFRTYHITGGACPAVGRTPLGDG
jgi:hypothetical protein